MNIVLIGHKSAGKTTIGKQLAASLDYAFVDLDAELLKKAGRHASVSALYADLGETLFRELEFSVLSQLKLEHTVFVTGGGTVMINQAGKVLKDIGFVVYLKASFDLLQRRNQARDQSGILKNTQGAWQDYQARDVVYLSYADRVIAVDAQSVDDIVKAINGKKTR